MKQQNKQPLASLFGINKTARIGAISATATLVLLVVLIALNACLGLLPQNIAKPDVTGSQTFKISGKTVDWLKTLNEDITLYFVCEGGKAKADGDLYAFLQRYEEKSDRIRVEVVDPSSSSDLLASFGLESIANMSVIVQSATRYRIIENASLYYYYYSDSYGNEMTMSPEEYQDWITTVSAYYTGESLSQLMSFVSAYFDGEARVTNAINYVTQDKVAIAYTLTGNGASSLDTALSRTLSQSCYDIRTMLTLESIPEDCDLLIINSPSIDLTEAEASVLSTYLASGGKLFLTTLQTVGALPKLGGVLAAYGMGFEASMSTVCDGNPNYYLESYLTGANYELFRTQIQSQHAVTGNFDESFVMYNAHAITTTEVENVTVTPWLYTSQAGYLDTDGNEILEKAEYNVGVIAESGDTKIVWISSPYALTQFYDAYADGGNFTLAISAFNWMSGIGSDSIAISSSVLNTGVLSVSVTQFAVLGILLVILIPVAVAVVGIIVRYIRKKK